MRQRLVTTNHAFRSMDCEIKLGPVDIVRTRRIPKTHRSTPPPSKSPPAVISATGEMPVGGGAAIGTDVPISRAATRVSGISGKEVVAGAGTFVAGVVATAFVETLVAVDCGAGAAALGGEMAAAIYSLSAEWEESASSVRHQRASLDLKTPFLFLLHIRISGHRLFSSEMENEICSSCVETL